MGKRYLFMLLVLSGLVGFNKLQAQDTLSNEKVEIQNIYVPVLSDARKVEITPNTKEESIELPKFDYSPPEYRYNVPDGFIPAEAIDIKPEKEEFLFENYTRLGFGNIWMPFAEVYIHNTRNKQFRYGGYGRHHSANRSDSYQDFSRNRVGLYGEVHKRKYRVKGQLDYARDVVHYYAFPDTLEIPKNKVNQIFNYWDATASIDNYGTRTKLDYEGKFDFYTFSNKQGLRENAYFLTNTFGGKIGRVGEIKVPVKFSYFNLDPNNNQPKYNRWLIRLNPKYDFKWEDFDFGIGFRFTYVNDSSLLNASPYISPMLNASWNLVPKKFNVFAELDGNLHANTLRSVQLDNNFVQPRPGLENTFEKIAFKLGFRGNMARKFDYQLFIHQRAFDNYLLYKADSNEITQFIPVYEANMSIFRLFAGISFSHREKLDLSLSGSVYTYNLEVEAEPWQLPDWDLNLDLRYLLAKKLLLSTKLYVLGDRPQQVLGTTQVINVKAFADFNVSAEYRYKKNISFFVNINNIVSGRYQRWYNYPRYGFNGMIGATFSL